MSTAKELLLRFIKRIEPLHAIQIKIHAGFRARRAFLDSTVPPILIYQMGKVGSTTIYDSLIDAGIPNAVLRVHFLSTDLPKHKEIIVKAGMNPPPYHIFLSEAVCKILSRNPHRPCKIVSLVRDPIARVISDVFENPYFASENIKKEKGDIDAEKAHKYIERKLSEPDTFKYLNEWFDRELKQVFDFDVFAEPFPVNVGHAVYRKANIEVLIIRLEDLSQKGPTAISQFLGLKKPLILKQSNVREKSKESETYKRVVNKIQLDSALCRRIYSTSRLADHFYGEQMVNQFLSKWTKQAP